MTIEITSASADEASILHDITRRAFAEYVGLLNPTPACLTETVREVAAAVRRGGAIIARIDGVAAASARYEVVDGHLYVSRVAVLPAYRGCGLAGELMHAMDQIAESLGVGSLQLQTRLNLPRNIRLYEKLGYRVIDTWQSDSGADVQVLMEKQMEEKGVPSERPYRMPMLATL
jgi:ribosomal protein S18 acetylase RimI-like enzyme